MRTTEHQSLPLTLTITRQGGGREAPRGQAACPRPHSVEEEKGQVAFRDQGVVVLTSEPARLSPPVPGTPCQLGPEGCGAQLVPRELRSL